MQMESVETSAGTAICCAPSRMACDFLALVNVAIDVLDLDRRVVHQNSDGESQAAERHDVYRLAYHAQNDDRSEDRKGNRHSDDQRAAPASQENQDHEAGKARGNDGFTNHSLNRRENEHGLV